MIKKFQVPTMHLNSVFKPYSSASTLSTQRSLKFSSFLITLCFLLSVIMANHSSNLFAEANGRDRSYESEPTPSKDHVGDSSKHKGNVLTSHD